ADKIISALEIVFTKRYSTVPQPMEEGKANVSVKLQPEIFNPFILSPLPEQTIRDVLVDWVQNKHLFSPTEARGMVITDVTHEVAYCYRLETFTEHRSVCLRFEPQCKTSKATVSPKPAGEVQEPQPWMFHNQVLNYRLIHTDRVTGCSYCQEQKWVMCKACYASTRVSFPVCHGRGRDYPERRIRLWL
uniref:Uncharacterized protein n=1 Tax=Oncorhynchus kisutch TaxID=8019 RepID=A0A8C7DG42_ONCKI